MDIKNIGPLPPQITPPISRNSSSELTAPAPTDGSKEASTGSAIAIPSLTEIDDATAQENNSQALNRSVETMNKLMKSLNNSLRFSVDEDTGKTVVKVIDSTTQEVIKQFPSEEALALTKALDKVTGLLVEQQA
ncbi:MAG: flagellar protein FlaG [Azovibrio sp.]